MSRRQGCDLLLVTSGIKRFPCLLLCWLAISKRDWSDNIEVAGLFPRRVCAPSCAHLRRRLNRSAQFLAKRNAIQLSQGFHKPLDAGQAGVYYGNAIILRQSYRVLVRLSTVKDDHTRFQVAYTHDKHGRYAVFYVREYQRPLGCRPENLRKLRARKCFNGSLAVDDGVTVNLLNICVQSTRRFCLLWLCRDIPP